MDSLRSFIGGGVSAAEKSVPYKKARDAVPFYAHYFYNIGRAPKRWDDADLPNAVVLDADDQETVGDLLLSPDKQLELDLIEKLDSTGKSTNWHIINALWMQKWIDHVQLNGPSPGPIDNAQLLDPNTGKPKANLRLKQHYRGINPAVWEALQKLYKGGPRMIRPSPDIYAPPITLDSWDPEGKQQKHDTSNEALLKGVEDSIAHADVAKKAGGDEDWDMVLVFPLRKQDHDDAHETHTIDEYVNLMMGWSEHEAETKEYPPLDNSKRIFKSARCFMKKPEEGGGLVRIRTDLRETKAASQITGEQQVLEERKQQEKEDMDAAEKLQKHLDANKEDAGVGVYKVIDVQDAQVSSIRKAMSRMAEERDRDTIRVRRERDALLRAEFGEYVHDDDGDGKISDHDFDLLIVRSVVKRLAQASGLTTYMYFSFDKDEVFCKIRADDQDLAKMADHVDYQIQLTNKPDFDSPDRSANRMAMARLWRNLPGDFQELGANIPQLDANLLGRVTKHPRMLGAIKKWGHIDEFDGMDPDPDDIYFAPYADYRQEEEYKPLYRSYPKSFTRPFDLGPWRQVDRIRLTQMLVEKHVAVHILKSKGYCNAFFPIHDQAQLAFFMKTWVYSYNPFVKPPLQALRNYFGEKIAFYFAFLDLYINYLFWPAILGIPVYIVTQTYTNQETKALQNYPNITKHPLLPCNNVLGCTSSATDAMNCPLDCYDDIKVEGTGHGTSLYIGDIYTLGGQHAFVVFVTFYSICMLIWSTFFLERWKNKTGVLNLLWGTSDLKSVDVERPEFEGVPAVHPVTDEFMVVEKDLRYSRNIRLFDCATFLFFFCAMLAATVSLLATRAAISASIDNSFLSFVGGATFVGIINSVIIIAFAAIYKPIAVSINNLENHRTDADWEDALIVKVFTFNFINSYFSMFYFAFARCNGLSLGNDCEAQGNRGDDMYFEYPCSDCLKPLGALVQGIFISSIVVNNSLELGLPFIMRKYGEWAERRAAKKEFGEAAATPEYEQVEKEAKLAEYGDMESFLDYAEMLNQFGFVTLFVVAYPLAPLFALANNLLEFRIDGFKIIAQSRRPEPKYANGIGAWMYFLQLMATMSIFTNLTLIAFAVWKLPDPRHNPSRMNVTASFWLNRITLFLVLEHVCLLVKWTVDQCIPDEDINVRKLRLRHAHIVDKVWNGLKTEIDGGDEEEAEEVDLSIHRNPNWKEDSSHTKLGKGGKATSSHVGRAVSSHVVTPPVVAQPASMMAGNPMGGAVSAEAVEIAMTTDVTSSTSSTVTFASTTTSSSTTATSSSTTVTTEVKEEHAADEEALDLE